MKKRSMKLGYLYLLENINKKHRENGEYLWVKTIADKNMILKIDGHPYVINKGDVVYLSHTGSSIIPAIKRPLRNAEDIPGETFLDKIKSFFINL